MSQSVTINGTVVPIPTSGDDPNWAQAIVQAFTLIANALNISSSTYDIPPQTYSLTSASNSNVAIPNLSFPTNTVQGFICFYSILITTTGTGAETISETGIILGNYDTTASTGNKWQLSREYVGPGASTTFSMTDAGQMQFSTTGITGTFSTGVISYRALSVLQN